jgi:cupin 2 domain-containing protein
MHKSLRIERIISKAHASPKSGWYDQNQNEWIILLKGEALLEFADNANVHLSIGDYIHIPKHCRHKVAWTAEHIETIWLAVHYD